MIRRHYFLFAAIAVVLLMLIVGGVKLLAPKTGGAGGGPAAQGAGGAPGAGAPAGGAGGAARAPGGAGGARGGQMIAVSTTTVQRQSFADRIEVLGVAKGRQSVSITSKNAELITAVRFRDGDRVRAGQILGVSGRTLRSPPLLVIRVYSIDGIQQVFEQRSAWQRAWAEYNT